MKRIVMYQTASGSLHATAQDADRALKKAYANNLSLLGHDMVKQCDGKYSKYLEFIDENLPRFVILQQIKDDMEVEPEDDDAET